jgi:polyhydroxybutyrate depolymerase
MQASARLLGRIPATWLALFASTLLGCGSTGMIGSGSGGSGAGSGGTTGAAEATGSAGASGTGGATASGGQGGTTGTAGTGGHAGRTGGAGTTGNAGATGGAGTTGAGGTTTSGGTPTPSAGCGVGGASVGTAQDLMLTVSGQATVRTYRLSVPTSYSPATPLPLIFGFHGVGGTGKGTQSSFNLESASTGGGKAIFAYPDALTKVEPDGTSAIDWVTPLGASNKGIDFAFFEALVQQIENTYCVDTSRVFATGISAGGIFTNFVGCWYGNILRAIAPVASEKPWSTPQSSPPSGLCTGDVAAMIIHGTNDPYSDYTTNGLGARDFWIAQDGCQTANPLTDATTPNACVDFQGCKAGLPVVMCSHDEGHAWPVAKGFSCSSTSTVCFDANIAVWNFFTTLP